MLCAAMWLHISFGTVVTKFSSILPNFPSLNGSPLPNYISSILTGSGNNSVGVHANLSIGRRSSSTYHHIVRKCSRHASCMLRTRLNLPAARIFAKSCWPLICLQFSSVNMQKIWSQNAQNPEKSILFLLLLEVAVVACLPIDCRMDSNIENELKRSRPFVKFVRKVHVCANVHLDIEKDAAWASCIPFQHQMYGAISPLHKQRFFSQRLFKPTTRQSFANIGAWGPRYSISLERNGRIAAVLDACVWLAHTSLAKQDTNRRRTRNTHTQTYTRIRSEQRWQRL